MSKRKLAVDFGNASTLLGIWDEATKDAYMLEVPPYTHAYAMTGPDSSTHVAPSIIHYHNKSDFLVGNQVLEHAARGGTVNPMSQLKSRFIKYKTKTLAIDNQTAATNYLSTLLLAAKKRSSLDDDTEIVLTNPVDAYEDYKGWLQDLSRACGFRYIRLLDEPIAAALTLIDKVDDGDVFLVFDYGAYTLDVALVRFSKKKHERVCERLAADVLEDMAGDAIDLWLTKYVLENHGSAFRDLDPNKISSSLQKQCRLAKQRLSERSNTTLELAHPAGPNIRIQLTRADIESVLQSRKLLNPIKILLKKLFDKANQANSIRMEDIRGVLMVGGSSYLLPVRAFLEDTFGAGKVFTQRPIQAVVHGATLHAGGAQIFDHIQHFYAFKYVDAQMQRFRPIVKPYVDYPYDGKEPVIVRASKPKQTEFKLYIYEFNSDPSDIRIGDDISHPPNSICLNVDAPVYIQVPHMVHKGDKAFEAHFSINSDKHLVINVNAYDKSGNPTIKLIKDLVVVQLAKRHTVAIPRNVIEQIEDSDPDDEAPLMVEYPVNEVEQVPKQIETVKAATTPSPVQKDKPKTDKTDKSEQSKSLPSLVPVPPVSAVAPVKINEVEKVPTQIETVKVAAPSPPVEKTNKSKAATPKQTEETKSAPVAIPVPSEKTKTQDESLKEKLLPYRNSFESSLSSLAVLFNKKHRDNSYKLTFLCDVLHKDAHVINNGIYWKLKDVVNTLNGANHSKKLDRNMARWVDVVVDPIDTWLVTWSKHCKESGKLSNNSWLIPAGQVSKRLVTAGSLLDEKIELLSALHEYDDSLSIEQQIVYLQNDDIICVKLADEIKEVRRYCWKVSGGLVLKDREIQNSQWHLLVLPAIQGWLDTCSSRSGST